MTILIATSAVTFAAFTLIWWISIKRVDASIVDFYWGPGFVVIGWLAVIMAQTVHWTDVLFVSLLTVWGVRLGWYMTSRHHGAEDARYAVMRDDHGADFPSRSLWMVFWLQAAIQWLAASPVLVLMLTDRSHKAQLLATPSLIGLAVAGLLLFVLGFVVEIVADRAVSRFKANPANKGQLLTTGLHARIRHPNYLGEIMLQWGLGIMAFAATVNPLALAGPALMTGLIVRLSGVPMLETQLSRRPGFSAWKARTGALLPRFGGGSFGERSS